MAALPCQVMLQTSRFVGAEGAQLELVLRVRQGQNAAFSFLKPDSPLHGYYRWLVNAQPQVSEPLLPSFIATVLKCQSMAADGAGSRQQTCMTRLSCTTAAHFALLEL